MRIVAPISKQTEMDNYIFLGGKGPFKKKKKIEVRVQKFHFFSFFLGVLHFFWGGGVLFDEISFFLIVFFIKDALYGVESQICGLLVVWNLSKSLWWNVAQQEEQDFVKS